MSKQATTRLVSLLLMLTSLWLAACGQKGDTEGLKQNIQQSTYNITSLTIRPTYTSTLSPLTTPPANPKYYFGHSDTEHLQAIGITDANDEIILKDILWSLTDDSNTAGSTSISQAGLLSMEMLAANQIKNVSVKATFGSLTATADIAISSYPLSTNGLSIKINNNVVNNTAQTVVVCDTKSLHAEGVFDDGSSRDVTSKINWASALADSNAKFVTTNPKLAVFSAHTNATYAVTADYKGQGTASVNLLVAQTGFSNMLLSSSSVSINTGDSKSITATANIDSGSGSVNTDVSQRAKWVSANTSIFTVNSSGTIKGIAKGGPVVLTASCGSDSATSSITVGQDNTIQSIEILDSDFSSISQKTIVINTTVNLKLRLHKTNGTTEDITASGETNWEVRDIPDLDEPITVNNTDNKGLVTATAVGVAEVVAKYKEHETDLLINVTEN